MKKLTIFFAIYMMAITGISGALAGGYKPKKKSPPPMEGLGDIFERVVAVGGSAAAGYRAGGICEDSQKESYPNLLAKQMGRKFSQPLIEFPGYVLSLEAFAKGNIKWWQYYYVAMGGQRKDGYRNQWMVHNYAVPGSKIGTAQVHPPEGLSRMQELILGDEGDPQLKQALDRMPTFITIFLGVNDIAEAIGACDPELLTSLDDFNADLQRLKQRVSDSFEGGDYGYLRGVAIATIPEIISSGAYFIEDNGSGDLINDFPEGSLKPFYVSGTNEDLRLTPDEAAIIQERCRQFNDAIRIVADKEKWALVDLEKELERMSKNGRHLKRADGGKTSRVVTTEYLDGFYCLDGINPCATGNAIIANAFIEAINGRYGTDLALIDEYMVSEYDSLIQNPYDPRPFFDGWTGKSMVYAQTASKSIGRAVGSSVSDIAEMVKSVPLNPFIF